MIAYISQADGAPCPTLVLDAADLPAAEPELRAVLTEAREWLVETGHADVLKIAIVAQSPHPLFDLDYRFVQCLPDRLDAFDFQGSCGHSILASLVVANARRWLPRPAPGDRVRLRILNNGDQIVCEVDESRRHGGSFTMYFVQPPGKSTSRVLMTGRPVDRLTTPAGAYEASLVSLGNPYVFVDAKELGIGSQRELFEAGDEVFDEMLRIRRSASALLGLPDTSVFPKIAMVAAYSPGLLSARAISVPRWHPTLALTGITCLAAAATAAGTVPARLYEETGGRPPQVEIATPGGRASATSRVEESTQGTVLQWVSVSRKQAQIRSGPLEIAPAVTMTRRLNGALH
ncbi:MULTISPECIES: PrpF domain-containing protein [Streptomyces]|uniref:PrpF domain-containing protein n=1 Tax=Streptomyces TaxID=1883 RepID=UPI00068F41E2|nr:MULTISPECIES: PrpF domain-containing protein [Streptomyces]